MPGISRTISTPKTLSPTLQAIRRFAAKDPDTFIQQKINVVDPLARSVPFIYNWSQQQVAKVIAEEQDAGKPIRLYVLKSRQVGLSTQICCRFFTKIWAQDNVEGTIIAHLEIRAQDLLRKCKGFYQSLPTPLQMPLAQDSKGALQFADTRGSLIIVSAKNMNAARGGTKQLTQFSEFAYYKNPVDDLAELEQLVPLSPYTEIIVETTAFMYGSQAHEFWRDCEKGNENYRTIFLPWQDDPANCVPFDSDRQAQWYVDEAFEYEPRLKERMNHFKLSPGHLYWAYIVLKDKCHSNYELFLQDYPCDPEEAWRSKGNSFFGTENLNAITPLAASFPSIYKIFGTKVSLGQEFFDLDDLETVDKLDENGSRPFVKVWKRPIPNGFYVVSGDSASGDEDTNFSSSYVVDMHTLEMMAEFHGRVRPDEHAYIISSLCSIYNDAMAAPEYNTPGNVTLNELKRLGTQIYRWRYFDDHRLRLSNKLGWQTNFQSRELMLALAKRIIEDLAKDRVMNKNIIKSKYLLDEMRTFVYNETSGKPEASGRCNDDRVMSWSIAIQVAAIETQGSDHDILSLYKSVSSERSATPLFDTSDPNYNPKLDPMDVIEKLEGKSNQYGTKDPYPNHPFPAPGGLIELPDRSKHYRW